MPQHDSMNASALKFALDLDVDVERNGENAKTVPFRMVARSGDSVWHPRLGNVVHDFQGMFVSDRRGRINVDYNHDPDQVVGYANHFAVVGSDLQLSGALTPFKEGDRAHEIIHKGKLGVPWQASISFAGQGIEYEEIPDGEAVEVNGRQFSGPLIVFRKWPLVGVAVCPNGHDPATTTTFARDSELMIPIRSLKMSSAVAEPVVTTPANAEADAAAKAAAVEAQKAEDDKKAKEAADAAAAAAAAATPAVETPPSDAVRATEGAKFMAAFGEVDGAKYFAKGLTFVDAQMAHMSTLSHRLEAAELKLSQIGSSGEPGPVSSTGGTEKKKPKPYAIPDPVAKK